MNFRPSLFIKESVLFAATQLLGIFVAIKIISQTTTANISQQLPSFDLTDLLVLGIFIVLLIYFSKRGGKSRTIFYKTFLALALFAGSQLSLSVLVAPHLALVISVFLVILFLYRNTVLTQNLIMILALAGIGAVFGITLTPMLAVILLVLLSFYDIIAVYKTKHMVKLAEGMIESKAIFGFVIPSRVGLFKTSMKNVSPGENFMILGSGDIVMPLILSSSVAILSLRQGIIIFIFSIAGLFITHLLFSNQKVKRPMAALPPIAMATIVGYLVVISFGL